MNIYENVSSLIGKTPVVRVKSPSADTEVMAKLEYFNPGGSIKDRIALSMIEGALNS